MRKMRPKKRTLVPMRSFLVATAALGDGSGPVVPGNGRIHVKAKVIGVRLREDDRAAIRGKWISIAAGVEGGQSAQRSNNLIGSFWICQTKRSHRGHSTTAISKRNIFGAQTLTP